MKKIMLSVLSLFMMLSLTACGGKQDDQSNANNDKIEIRLLTRMAGTSKQVEIFQDILEEFEADYPEVTIIDDSQGDESSFNNILKTDRASGTLANIYRVQGVANLAEYIENDLVMDMTEALEADPEWAEGFTEGAINYYSVPGYDGIYGIPMESGIIGFYYNEQLFDEAGISEFPETWSDFKVAIEKLNAIDVQPIALGGKSAYKLGHLHNMIFYRWLGVDKAKELGNRKIKWNDPEVVETLEFIQELHELGAWDKDALGIDNDVATTEFLEGRAAMVFTGPWDVSTFNNPEKTELTEHFKLAKFPYFEEKPEFKNHDMQVISPYMVNGQLEGREKELTIELVKRLTSAEAARRFAEEATFIIPRTDADVDLDVVTPLFHQNVELSGTSEAIAVDVFDYDPLQSMQDRTREAFQSLLTGVSPEDAANEIQKEIERNE